VDSVDVQFIAVEPTGFTRSRGRGAIGSHGELGDKKKLRE
jgi:hypothetical protein